MNVFLSHSYADRKVSGQLRAELERLGFRIETDDPGLDPGREQRHRIEEAIRRAHRIVVLVSPQEADEVQRITWQEALVSVWQDSAKRILPVLLKGARVPPFVYSSKSPFEVVEIVDPRNPREIERAARELAGALEEGEAVTEPARSSRRAAEPPKEWHGKGLSEVADGGSGDASPLRRGATTYRGVQGDALRSRAGNPRSGTGGDDPKLGHGHGGHGARRAAATSRSGDLVEESRPGYDVESDLDRMKREREKRFSEIERYAESLKQRR